MRSRPDIAILGLNYQPEPTGIAPYTTGLAEGLSERGHEVTAHVAHPHYPEWEISNGYGQWLRTEYVSGVELRRRRHYVPRSPRGVRRLLSELSFGARIVMTRWGQPRVVIAVSPSLFSTALVVLRILLTPRRPALIVWVQDIYTLGLQETGEGGGLAARVTRWVEASTLGAADRVVVIHDRFAKYVHDELAVDPNKIAVIRNWAHLPDRDFVDPRKAKNMLGWPTDTTLAVHTGNMGAKQGLENIVEAARVADKEGAPVHFILVGDGSERQKLSELSRGITRLSFVDSLDEESYGLALNAADVLLVNEKPGVSGMAVPSKLTSYFHAGRPVVAATDPEGISAAEIAASGAGVVIPAGEPRSLVDGILALRANAELMAEFGANGRRYREAVLGEERAMQRWTQLISALIPANRKMG